MNYRKTMWAERTADIYSGPKCDEHKAQWKTYAEGDMDSDTSTDNLQLAPKTFPAGTKVEILIPVCPKCEMDAEMCDCGFDWKKWTEEQYA